MGYDIHGLNPTRNVKEPHILAVIPNHGKTSFCWNCAAGDIDG